jgi:hypothetical protein
LEATHPQKGKVIDRCLGIIKVAAGKVAAAKVPGAVALAAAVEGSSRRTSRSCFVAVRRK